MALSYQILLYRGSFSKEVAHVLYVALVGLKMPLKMTNTSFK
jgi:hypothetical protein